MPAPSGPPVDTAPPNAPQQTPAFEGQTRAPEVISDFQLATEVVAGNLSNPWAMDFLPDGRVIVSERVGNLVLVSPDGGVSAPLTGMPDVSFGGQGGMLDVALAPDFSQSRMVYISYAEPRGNSQNGTTVARGRMTGDDSGLENLEVIFRQQPAWNSNLHFGSRLVWGDDGLLYVTLGERSHAEPRQLAQDLETHLGKVVRIRPDGSVPQSNPFVDTAGAAPEVWSYGHRNPQGAALHPQTGVLWTIEHGPRGGDELNQPEAGKNYGWPVITYGEDYNGSPLGEGITQREGMEQPIYYWDPVIAPSDMAFYQGDMFPSWSGNLLIGSLNPGGLVRVMLDGERVIGEERFLSDFGRVRDVAVADDGAVWFVNDSGELVRVTPEL